MNTLVSAGLASLVGIAVVLALGLAAHHRKQLRPLQIRHHQRLYRDRLRREYQSFD